MSDLINEFNDYRSKMNEVILAKDNLVIKRLFNLDTQTYADGALNVKTKEMLGLVASMVLRCDDCIKYHLLKCKEQHCSTEEVYEIFAVANIVGGTIVIPHTRRAAERARTPRLWPCQHPAGPYRRRPGEDARPRPGCCRRDRARGRPGLRLSV